MITLRDLTELWDRFCTSAIENDYNSWAAPKDMTPIAEELINAIKQYIEESDDTKHKD